MIPANAPSGVVVNGFPHRCGDLWVGHLERARCELPIGHDGPGMPQDRHMGRDEHSNEWIVWVTHDDEPRILMDHGKPVTR